jgi:hypothetical protein
MKLKCVMDEVGGWGKISCIMKLKCVMDEVGGWERHPV